MLFDGLRHIADLPHLDELAQLGGALNELAQRAFTLARENPGWLAPSHVAVAGRLTESAHILHECSQTILRQRDAFQHSVNA